ncbi:hypothetical protein C8Q76DRAFT_634279 [Earliella scabrosa]|nr:hypothetical protein C8Q76DRAFT_634279 [Earliella scabrosa]
MPLYREQDVERRAWGKHGGPEAFDAYLDKLQQRHVKKHGPHKPFTQPAQYASRGGMVYIVGLKESQISCDRYVGKSPTLLRIKQKMPEWIWKACNEALEWQDLRNYESLALGGRGFFVRDQDREGPMERALELSRRYPERPKDPLVSSPSVDMLREVLTTAPAIPKGEAYDEIIHELVRYEDFAGDVSYRWSDAYVGRICSALFGVIQEHGTGDEGWRTARWEVYDKVRFFPGCRLLQPSS